MKSHPLGSPRPPVPHALFLGVALCALLVVALAPSSAVAATFDPLNIISTENWRASSSLSQADIQAFLVAKGSCLRNYVAPDINGVVKPASLIIFEAAQVWGVNPKLILVTLQKEQSLITSSVARPRTYHTNTDGSPDLVFGALEAAMGASIWKDSDCLPLSYGYCPHAWAALGFGKQIWNGTRVLGATTGSYAWYPGKRIWVHSYPDSAAAGPGSDVHIWITPANQPTWNFYTYTPYYPQSNVWKYWNDYFGDPQTPPRLRPVYRFYRVASGTHFYTASEAEKYTVIKNLSRTYRLEGVAYSLDTSATNMTTPLYRFYNKKTGTHFYTASEAEKANVIAKLSGVFAFEGVAYNVSSEPTGSTPVYRFYNKKTGTHFYTASEAEKANVIAKLSGTYRYEGIAFYLGVYVPPVTPPDPPALTAPPVTPPDPSALTTPSG